MSREIAEVPVSSVKVGMQVTYGGDLLTVAASHPRRAVLRDPFTGKTREIASDCIVLTDVRSLRPV